MALTELIFGANKKAEIGIVQFDCAESETHTNTVEITDHPVEEGSDISDHIRELPDTLELHGLVTNTPIIFLASRQAESPLIGDNTSVEDRVETAYAELKRAQKAGELVSASTTLKQYKDMVIESLSAVRDASRGNILDINIRIRKLQKARALSIDSPTPIEAANKAAQNKGKTAKKAASAKQTSENASMLADIKNSIGSLFGG